MNEFSVTLLVLGLPGIICLFLTYKLIGRLQRSTIEVVFLVFLYSVLSYALVDLSGRLLNLLPCVNIENSAIAMLLTAGNHNPEPQTLLYAVFASIILAYFVSYTVRFNLINRVGQKINATKRYGDEDVWHYFHNAPEDQKNDGWVIVRDLKQGLAYYCYISTWSDSGMDRELTLSDASVFVSDTEEYLYDVQHLYISRNRDEIVIEIPPSDAKSKDKWQLNTEGKTEVQNEREKTTNGRYS